MGATSMHREKGRTNEELFLGMMPEGTRFHACGTVNNVFYAAVESPGVPGMVWAYIVETQWSPRSFWNFTYKDMDETMGPYSRNPPARVLDALSATENPYALEWREEARLNLEQAKALRGLKHGDEIMLGTPLPFSDGKTLDTFTITRRERGWGKGITVELTHEGVVYRLPRWQGAVVAVIRDGQRQETPVGRRREENAYVRAVQSMCSDERARGAVVERYGERARYGVAAWEARQEFRRGDVWELATAS